jgi:hypothetical protein
MARPRNEIPTVTVTVRLPEPVAAQLALKATEENTNRSALAARFITEALVPPVPTRARGFITPPPTHRSNGVTPILKGKKR